MPSEQDITAKFWSALKDDMTVMLGLRGAPDGHAQPMTALLDEDGPGHAIWFFTARDVDLVRDLGAGADAVMHFAAKGHGLFASVAGRLTPDNDRAVIDRLWNSFIAAWFEGGKDDPKLQLLRFDPGNAQIWLNENSLFAGVKLLLGADPKQSYKDKVAEVDLS